MIDSFVRQFKFARGRYINIAMITQAFWFGVGMGFGVDALMQNDIR